MEWNGIESKHRSDIKYLMSTWSMLPFSNHWNKYYIIGHHLAHKAAVVKKAMEADAHAHPH
jgi:hypothetical protein